jgi:ribosomal protein S12 methylthiotransferase
LHYAYPHKFPLEIIEVMKRQPKICNYLDMPLQHISDPVLHRMRRQITSEETKELVSKIREIHPEIRLRTTFLVGFPEKQRKIIKLYASLLKKHSLTG